MTAGAHPPRASGRLTRGSTGSWEPRVSERTEETRGAAWTGSLEAEAADLVASHYVYVFRLLTRLASLLFSCLLLLHGATDHFHFLFFLFPILLLFPYVLDINLPVAVLCVCLILSYLSFFAIEIMAVTDLGDLSQSWKCCRISKVLTKFILRRK